MAYTDVPFEELLDAIAAETPAPGGGSVAAFVTEMAAIPRGHGGAVRPRLEGAAGAVAQAETLRHRAAPLAVEDAVTYENVLTAMRMPKELEPEVRDTLIGETLSRAADVPLHIAQTAADVAELASEIAICGNPNLSGDATAASLLAASASRVAANLVEINLSTVEGDNRVELALALVRSADKASQRRSATPSERGRRRRGPARGRAARGRRGAGGRARTRGVVPGLATVLVGEDYAAQAYERRVRAAGRGDAAAATRPSCWRRTSRRPRRSRSSAS